MNAMNCTQSLLLCAYWDLISKSVLNQKILRQFLSDCQQARHDTQIISPKILPIRELLMQTKVLVSSRCQDEYRWNTCKCRHSHAGYHTKQFSWSIPISSSSATFSKQRAQWICMHAIVKHINANSFVRKKCLDQFQNYSPKSSTKSLGTMTNIGS